MAQDAPRRQRARPVADAPVDGPLARPEALAKGWAVALVEDAPLSAVSQVPGEALVREGAQLCVAALAALRDEAALTALTPGGADHGLAARAGQMAGAGDPGAVARGIDALHDVLWAALGEELRAPPSGLVAELAARLSLVCAVIRDAALSAFGGSSALAGSSSNAGSSAAAGAGAGAGADAPAPTPASTMRTVHGPVDAAPPSAGQPLWMNALDDAVGRARALGTPLSLLLSELEDSDRVLASTSPERAGLAFGDFLAALRRVLGHGEILVWESDARAWVIARDTARPAAHSLAARIAESVGESASLSGAPPVASVGVAVLGEDGETTAALVDAAEEARFTASARGIEVSRRVPAYERDLP